MNSMRSEFNAYRWKARKEWANKKVTDLQKAEKSHDLGAIHRILRETGLSVEKTFSAKGREFCLTSAATTHLESHGQDQTEDLGNFADRVPDVPMNHKLDWLPDGQEIRSTICQMRDSAPSTDEITKTLIIAGGEDSLDTAVSLIQILWESEYKNWEQIVADIEVCMLYKGKGPRNLPQNQRFIMLISFGLRVVARIVARRLTSHAESNLLIVDEQYGFRSKHSDLGPVLVLTLCIEDAVKIKFNPEYDPFACVFADIAKAYPSVPRPELMAVLKKSCVPSKLLNIIRGLMEHARYRVKNSEGHDDKWFRMSLGLKEGCPAAPIEFSIYHSFIMKDLKSRLLHSSDENIRVGFGSEDFNDLPLIRENSPTKKNQVGKKSGANVEARQSPLVRG